jgi:hypothetical protein
MAGEEDFRDVPEAWRTLDPDSRAVAAASVENAVLACGDDWLSPHWMRRTAEIVASAAGGRARTPQQRRRVATSGLLAELAEHGIYSDPAQVLGVWAHAGTVVLNPFRGCNFGCVYCFRPPEDAGPGDWFLAGQPVQVHDEAELVDRMLAHPQFVAGTTVIGLHTATTDPFLPATRASTYRMLCLLREAGLDNPVMVITKMPVTAADVAAFADAAPLRILLLVTYNGAPGEMETFSGVRHVREGRWASLDLLADLPPHVRAAHYYRPIVPTWNDSDEQIVECLRFGARLGITVIGGLKPIAGLDRYAARRGLPVEVLGGQHAGAASTSKLFPAALERRILDHHARLGLTSVVVKDQSCALTLMLRQSGPVPNIEAVRRYDALTGRDPVCLARCPDDQVAACDRGGQPDAAAVRRVLSRLGHPGLAFHCAGSAVRVPRGALTDKEIAVLVAATGAPVTEEDASTLVGSRG